MGENPQQSSWSISYTGAAATSGDTADERTLIEQQLRSGGVHEEELEPEFLELLDEMDVSRVKRRRYIRLIFAGLAA
ncbi:hypothetical protein KCP69_07935 [Salmonella enterica subsp. enterica]|nr:hypothetical protein KCP69_07935 [Salmonella enterica subsp. enterica]